jgi:hypothetical protein
MTVILVEDSDRFCYILDDMIRGVAPHWGYRVSGLDYIISKSSPYTPILLCRYSYRKESLRS